MRDNTFLRLDLTMQDTLVLKALAIFCIVAHNFLHSVSPAGRENEFEFHGVDGIWNVLMTAATAPWDIPQALFAFFGHYGVQIFVFLSGYGLTRKLFSSTGEQAPPLRTFFSAVKVVLGQIGKLLQLIAVAAPAAFMWKIFVLDQDAGFVLRDFLQFLTFTNNLNPTRGALWGFVSVWWFFALIVQLYLLYPMLVTGMRVSPRVTLLFVLFCLGMAGVLYDYPPIANEDFCIPIFATPLSHATVFTLGIAFAMGYRLKRECVRLFGILFLFSLFIPTLFSASFVSVTILIMSLYETYGRRLTRFATLLWFGKLSMFVFVLHGFLRRPLVEKLNAYQVSVLETRDCLDAALTLGSFALWFVGVVLLSWALQRVFRTTTAFCPLRGRGQV